MSILHPPILSEATARQLEQAAADNHTRLFFRNAIGRGGEVRTIGGLSYTYDGNDYQSMIAFPVLDKDTADEQLDEMINWYREHPVKGLGCWSLDPPQPADLGKRLLSRGFQDGWRPCWMALDLQQPNKHQHFNERHQPPGQLRVVLDNYLSLHHLTDIPYTGKFGAVSPSLMKDHPEQTRQFIALLDGKITGHASLFFTTGEFGVAGLYDVAVAPSARRKGIGKALVQAACLEAKNRGYRYVVLNATGRRMYEQVGFQHIGDGFTWWMLQGPTK